MIESVKRKTDESMFKMKVTEAINRMLDCMLTKDAKTCKNCSDVNICSFLTESVFAYRQQYSLLHNSSN
jgi:hypothetical protein